MNVYSIICPKCKWQMEVTAPSTYPIRTGYRAPHCQQCDFQTRECDRTLSKNQPFYSAFEKKILQALTTIGELYDHD